MDPNSYREALKQRLAGKKAADPRQRQAAPRARQSTPQQGLKAVADQQLEALRATDYSRYRTGQ